jgi:ketosteroid isomerase-like protein
MKVQAPADAGSAPRKQFLVDFNKAFAESDVDYIISHVSEDVVWEMVGDKKVQGKEADAGRAGVHGGMGAGLR